MGATAQPTTAIPARIAEGFAKFSSPNSTTMSRQPNLTHQLHRSAKYRAAVSTVSNRAHTQIPAPDPSAFWSWLAVAILFAGMVVGVMLLPGCRATKGSDGTSAAGNEAAVITALADQLPPHTDRAGLPILESLVKHVKQIIVAIRSAAEDYDEQADALKDEREGRKHDNEKSAADIKAVKGSIGYRIEQWCRWLWFFVKLALFLFAGWGIAGVILAKFFPAIGIPAFGLWKWIAGGILSRVMGALKGHKR